MHLTSNTTLINKGTIYAGGSGGSSVGLEYTSPSLPFINTSISVGAGFSGGGGSESGAGGTTNAGGINIGIFENGSSATCCANSTPGAGGAGNTGINIPIVSGFASVEISPSANGGNGGAFAQQGTEGSVALTIQLQTILGNINVYSSSVYNGPASGSPGVAIKRYSNTLTGGITDGNYNNTEIKGAVGP
jgi:hypothetical protein